MNESDTVGGGRYALAGRIAGGGQATTYRAVDKREGKLVVVKRFQVTGAPSWKDVELAEREIRVLQGIKHEQLPRYLDHFEEDGSLYLVLEFIEGQTIKASRESGRRFNEMEVLRFLSDAANVLAYLHRSAPPIIHRDIKPSNVIRRADGRYVIVDLGAVRDSLRPEGGSTVVGTFGYMPPEQFQGRAYPATDIYAVAATALYMLTGREPEELPHTGLSIDVQTALAGHASKPLIQLLSHCLTPDPEQRTSDLGALLTSTAPPPQPRKQRPQIETEDPEEDEPDIPWPLRMLLVVGVQVGLTLLQLLLTLWLQALIPLVLTLLSWVISSKLRVAAEAVRRAGDQAIDAVGASRRRITRQLRRTPKRPRRRGPRVDAPRQRVDESSNLEDLEEPEAAVGQEAGKNSRSRHT